MKQNNHRRSLSPALAILLACTVLSLQGCSWGSNGQPSFSGGYSNDGPGKAPKAKHLKDAKPKWEPRTRAGNAPSYHVLGKNYRTLTTAEGYQRRGIASWYGRKFHGKNTANGEKYDMYAMTAAHKSLPIPSYVRVRNLNNGKQAIVRINDRGPFIDSREIDLSYAAAFKLGVFHTGTAPVEVTGIEVDRNGDIIKPRQHHKTNTAATQLATPPTQALPETETFTAQAVTAPTADPAPTSVAEAQQNITEQWWVQAGAFQQLNSARSLSLKLQADGFPNQVIDDRPNNLPYKIRIGPFIMETHARWAQVSLSEKGLNKGFVVKTTPP